MKICLISVEIFAWGKYGGFGRATRTIGRELVRRGHEVFAVVPRRKGQGRVEDLDGIKVFGFPLLLPWRASRFFKMCDADIYHSCEPSFGSYLAMKAMSRKKHMVTVRDPRDFQDWKMEFELPSLSKIQVLSNYMYESNALVKRTVRKMDAVFTTSEFLIPKVSRIYRLDRRPGFLPTPVNIPEKVEKSKTPVVCYLGRTDKRKRPTMFFDLAEKFPHVNFIAMGKSRNKQWESFLRKSYSNIPNLELTGFVDQFSSNAHSSILGKSWIMVNTATRESLPNAFLESAAHGCAILSHVNPQGFASRFGYHAEADDFEKGLQWLLERNRWRELGRQGYQFIKETFATDIAMGRHIDIYHSLLTG